MRFFVLFFAFCTSVYGNHDWNGYHWNPSNLNLVVKDKTTSNLYNVTDVMNDWNNLNTPVHLEVSSTNPNIEVSEAFNPRWLGLARIYIEDGHITQGEVKLNTKLLKKYYGLPEAKHVLCQEVGHVIGLDHNRDGPSDGEGDDTCMNDVGYLGEYTTPNNHDEDTLNQLYNHTHDTTSGSTTTTASPKPKPCHKNPNHPLCSGQNAWYTIHVTWFDPNKYGIYPDEVINEQECDSLATTLRYNVLLLTFVMVTACLL